VRAASKSQEEEYLEADQLSNRRSCKLESDLFYVADQNPRSSNYPIDNIFAYPLAFSTPVDLAKST